LTLVKKSKVLSLGNDFIVHKDEHPFAQ